MSGTWNVGLGSLWRTYKVQGRRTAPFVKRGTLRAGDGRLELTTQYDPPGSGWMALGAALITGILVTLVAQATGGCAGPGWLLWFIGIALLRRRTVTLSVQEADAAIIDPANRRLAFHIDFEGKPRWVAVDVPQNFDEAAQAVVTQMPGRVVQDKIDRALTSGSMALIVLAILLGTLILVSIIAVFVFTVVRPRRPPARVSSVVFETYAESVMTAITLLPGFFRKTRYIEE
jgi:hypothetical protein